MKIDFKKPKYVLPIILLPFFCLLFYGYKSFSKEVSSLPKDGLSEIQTQVGEASQDIQKKKITSKLDASRETYSRASDGYTAIKGIQLDVEESNEIESLYNEKEKRLLDSIDNALRMSGIPAASASQKLAYYPTNRQGMSKEDEAILKAIDQLEGNSAPQVQTEYEDPMELFKAQMAVIDSISKANDPDYQKALQHKEKIVEKPEPEPEKYRVQKANSPTTLFNTVTQHQEGQFIKAIVDQDIKNGTLGARLRIRVLDDLMIGKAILKSGTYLYALISGYERQRVKLTISSVMVGDTIYPIELSIYDTDGIEGLYVPASAFREFSKELGANTTGGMNLQIQQDAETMNQIYMSALQKMFSSTSQAVSKEISKNKANLKYGTSVYLIDTKELKENENLIQPKN